MEKIVEKIEDALRIKGMTKKDLCRAIDMTENGLANSFKQDSLKVAVLIKIANVLNRPIQYFFDSGQEMDFDKMKKAFTLDNTEAKTTTTTGEIPERFYNDLKISYSDLRNDYAGERARVDKLIDALTGNDKKSDKALIDYMGGVVADDGAGPPKRKAANW